MGDNGKNFLQNALSKAILNRRKNLHMHDDDDEEEDVIWMYINRGIFEDEFGDDILFKLHSDEYMDKVNKALGI